MSPAEDGSGEEVVAIVTTGRKPGPDDERRARALADRYGLTYVPRGGLSVQALRRSAVQGSSSPAVIVAGADGLTLHASDASFRYHPGMGVNRIRTLRRGGEDWMVKAMGLLEGDSVLDATLGIGSDLLVASYVTGPTGRAVGLESERLLSVIVREGMRSYRHDIDAVTHALGRIEVVWADYRLYLVETARPASFDIVYFDPIFAEPVPESKHMIPLRALGNRAPLERRYLERAAQVARRRVVVKDRREGPYAGSGWFDDVTGGREAGFATAYFTWVDWAGRVDWSHAPGTKEADACLMNPV